MRALTIRQPWASLIAIGAKRIETRSWQTHYQGPLAIHASAHFPRDCRDLVGEEPFHSVLAMAYRQNGGDQFWVEEWSRNLPLGSVVAVVDIRECWQFTGSRTYQFRPDLIDGRQVTLTEHDLAFGDCSPGRYGWLLENSRRLRYPMPAKGRQGLWNWEPSAEVRALLGDTQP